MKKIARISLFTFTFSLLTYLCPAQYTNLLTFSGTNNGATPWGTLVLSGNVLYGMTFEGGTVNDGVVFSIHTDGTGYKMLIDFTGTNGLGPYGSVRLSGKTLFGMTTGGGAHSNGTIFSIDTNGNNYKDLHDFDMIGGASPTGDVTIAGTKLFGMTTTGGLYDSGMVFSMDTAGSNFKDIHDFDGPDGDDPNGSVTISGYKLYGMTFYGGYHDSGVIFSMDTNGGGFKVMHDFTESTGFNPLGSLLLVGGKLFGMPWQGGTSNAGTIFSIDTNGSNYKDILNFNNANGASPTDGNILQNKGHNLYGLIGGGGANGAGRMFVLDTSGSGYLDLYDFVYATGGNPYGGLTLGVGGMFYGMNNSGETFSDGNVFSFDSTLTTAAQTLSAGNSGVSVYPNPSTGMYTISLGYPQFVSGLQTMVEVYNVLGEQVLEQALRFTQGDNILDLSGQPNGVYLYRLVSMGGNLIGEGKVVIQK